MEDQEARAAEERNNEASFKDVAKKMLMASVGALSLAREEIEEFIDRLVERGELEESEGEGLLHEFLEKRKERAEKFKGHRAEHYARRFEARMRELDLPTKDDFNALSDKLGKMADKIEEMARRATEGR